MTVILDCDIASTFAKIDRLVLLKKIFPKSDICITSSVYTELLRAKRIGFSFPDKIFDTIKQIALMEEEIECFRRFSQDKRIHAGEAEGLAIAKVRDAVFLTNDTLVIGFCNENEIKALDLKDVLTLMGEKKVVTRKEILDILRDIEAKDNTIIKGKEEILEIFEGE